MGVSDLPEDLQRKLAKWEANKPEHRTVRVLEDIASMAEEVVRLLDSQEERGEKSSKEMGAVLVDMRESLSALKSRKDPEYPDFSKPLLSGLARLEKSLTSALSGIDLKPEFKPNIQVSSPEVTVEAPDIDLRGVEKALKSDIPKAFREAIALIPATPEIELSPLEDLLKQMSEQLDSIDTASRLKTQFPSTLKVTNPDGSEIGNVEPTLAVRIDDVTTTDTVYIGKAVIGAVTNSPVWQIAKLDTSSGLVKTWAAGSASFNQIWDNRATTITYS